jgi:hypothetical protein
MESCSYQLMLRDTQAIGPPVPPWDHRNPEPKRFLTIYY